MGELKMSARERRRLEMMSRVRDKHVLLVKAAELLDLSYRQAKRLWRRYRQNGDAGLVHRLRGRPSGRNKGEAFRQAVLDLYKTRYGDFGPTLACEHLVKDGYRLNHETLRRWLIRAGRWERRRKRATIELRDLVRQDHATGILRDRLVKRDRRPAVCKDYTHILC